ncbi:MAG TPA: response regulator [Candidatus Baltobacteraceae bacterium]|nr:response regulator [Candidatus Baltobacteraceae bacterium]
MHDTRKKLFIVDDDAALIRVYDRMLRPILEINGVEVQTFGDADSVLEAIEREGMPTVLLTDDRMPNMTGRELAARLRQRGYDGKILMVSGTADEDVLADGVDELMQKPVDTALLRNTVRSFLG